MKPLPTWLIVSSLIVAAIVGAWSHWYDRRRDQPLDWDPQAWRVWLARHDRIPVLGVGPIRKRVRRAVVFLRRLAHPRRRRIA